MGILGDAINTIYNASETISSTGKGFLENLSTWANGLISSTEAAISAAFNGDVVGINVNGIPNMINAIEEYINRINNHLNDIKVNTSTERALKGEYALAVKAYVSAACEVCYKITSQLRYFEDKLVMVGDAYKQKDQNLSSTIGDTTQEMNSSWEEYKRTN